MVSDGSRSSSRGQTTIDFAIGASIFLISVAFVFTFIPTLLQPFQAGASPGDELVSERVAAELVGQTIADNSEGAAPNKLDEECTKAFFNGKNKTGCRYDGRSLEIAFGLTERNSNMRVTLTPVFPSDQFIFAQPNDPSVKAVHESNYYIPSSSNTVGNSLNSVTVSYPDNSTIDLTGVNSRDDIKKAGFDTDNDGKIETDVTDDIECCPPSDGVIVSDGGTTLRIEFSGNYNTSGDTTFIIRYTDVENPKTEGNYTTTVSLNGETSKSEALVIGGEAATTAFSRGEKRDGGNVAVTVRIVQYRGKPYYLRVYIW